MQCLILTSIRNISGLCFLLKYTYLKIKLYRLLIGISSAPVLFKQFRNWFLLTACSYAKIVSHRVL